MGTCISKCFTFQQYKKQLNSQNTLRTETSVRLDMMQINIQQQIKQYFPSYDPTKSIQWKDILPVIKNEFNKYNNKHNKLSNYYLNGLLEKYQKFFFTQHQLLDLLYIVNRIIKNQPQNNNKIKSKQFIIKSHQQIHKISQNLYHLQKTLLKSHKTAIQQLKFICQHNNQKLTSKQDIKKQNQNHHKQHCHSVHWSDFKFDLSEQQIQTVVITVRHLIQNNLDAFAFLVLYFQISLNNKSREVRLKKLQQLYQENLQKLIQKYPAKDVLLFNSTQPKCKLKDITNKQIEPSEIIFSNISLSHYDQLKEFLLQKTIEAKNDLLKINQMLREVFQSSTCQIEFQSDKFMSQKSLQFFNHFIIQSLENQPRFQDKFEELRNAIKESVKKLQKVSAFTIQQLTKVEEQQIDKFLKKLLQNEEKLEININEAIKVKCYFNDMDTLIESTNHFIESARKNGFQVISMKNRLNFIEKDIKLALKFPNYVISIKLILKLRSISNEFNKKLVLLKKNDSFHSCLSNLVRYNRFQTNNFFIQLFERYHHMSEYLNETDVQQMAQLNAQIDKFKITCLQPQNIELSKNSHQNLLDVKEIIQLLKEIKITMKQESIKNKSIHSSEFKLSQQKVNEVLLSFGIKDYPKTKQLIFKLQEQQIAKDKLLLEILGDIYQKQNDYDQSLEYYLKCSKIYQQQNFNETYQFSLLLEKIANIYELKCHYKQALQAYEHSLLIKQKIYQPGSIQSASILFKIGKLYEIQQQYKDSKKFYQLSSQIHSQLFNQNSLQYAQMQFSLGNLSQITKRNERSISCFQKCLKIYETFQGAQSEKCASTLDKLGSSHLFKADYEKSFQCYFQSLSIKQKIKGRNAIDCASTLAGIGSVFEKKDEYDSALKYYKQSLLIIEKFYGKQSIQCVKYLNNIIVVFYHEQKYQQALAYGLRCLQIQQKEKGKDSIDCSGTLFGLSLAYEKLGMKHEAYAVCRKAYRIRQKTLGDQHTLTQQALNRGEYLIQRQNENCLRDVFTF